MPTLSRRHLLALPLLATSLALSTGAHAWSWSPGSAVEGSGKIVEDTRSVPAFQKLRLDGSFDVRVQIGAPAKVVVRADDNLQALIVTRVEGDTLVVGTEREQNVHSRSKVLVTVVAPSLSAASLRGSGDLSIEGATGGPFELSLSGSGDVRMGSTNLSRLSVTLAGSGDVKLQGRAETASLSIAGSGDIHAADLQTRNAKVSIAGSGDAEVQASDLLDVNIAGSGDVRYAGSPRVQRQLAGSGEVRPLH
ncbi:head GIN domain-containing protein [Ideonella oryzae]|uniref:DUF2807 domain-containing protein n=1 Tax=Ideonella oryzae TaxID=2937441 RepID=A0ABT1BK30_9BURK|nr:head GIN domain-containing protein [Ideonella oryzae]MCO5976561.1 DUF2807 domain-containing protein [Ideonella oryzae]